MIDEQDKKRKFAERLLQERNPYQAALGLFPDTGDAMKYAIEWAESEEIKKICQEIIQRKGDDAVMPTKETIVREVHALGRIADAEIRARLAAYRLIAEVLGYIEKPQPQVNVSNSNVYRVMAMPEQQSEAEWEQQSIAQQRKLLEDARTTKH